METIVKLGFMLFSLNKRLKDANDSGDLNEVRRLTVARTGVLLSLVDAQKTFILNRLSS